MHAPTGARCGCWGNRGGRRDLLPPASAFTPLLPLSMSVAEPFVSVDHGAPAVLILGSTQTPQRDLSPAQLFYVNGHWTVVGWHLLDGCIVAPPTTIKANLAAVSDSELHPGSDAVIHLLLCSLGLVPDVVLYVSEQSRVQ